MLSRKRIDVYHTIHDRKISINEKNRLIKLYFKQSISNIRFISNHKEFTNKHFDIEFGILYQYLKRDILNILSLCNPKKDRNYIKSELYLDINWNKYIFNLFQNVDAKESILWFFFYIPYFHSNHYLDKLDEYRTIYLDMIQYVIKNWRKDLYFNEKEFIYSSGGCCLTYPICYQNRNNKDILSNYCLLLRTICPFLNYTSNFINHNINHNVNHDMNHNIKHIEKKEFKRRKICFITDGFTKDSCVLRDRIGIIGKLINKFDIYIASFRKFNQITGHTAKIVMKQLENKYIYLGNTLDDARVILEKEMFEIIIYPDIGMKLKPYLLAYSRLAPIQINTWGHSETSGINTIDYYFSSKYFNLESSACHFSEKLILFNSLSTYYISPISLFLKNNKSNFKSRDYFGLKEQQNVYGCLQTFYKFNNRDFLKALNQILLKDPNGILLLSNAIPYSRSHLELFSKIFGNNINKIRWFPCLEIQQFLNIISLCDVILDPYPFGGCNTSYEAFDFDIPVVTYPSDYLHGRFTMGLYKKMGFDDCIVNSFYEYIKLALDITRNINLKNKISRKIQMYKHKILQEKDSIIEYETILNNL